MGNPPYNVCSTQCLSTLSAVAAKNYEFEKKLAPSRRLGALVPIYRADEVIE
jgi:hypothetical protein